MVNVNSYCRLNIKTNFKVYFLMEEKIRGILSSEFGLMADSLDADQPIFSSGLLDSLSSLRLVMSVEQNFGVRVSPLDISLDDVNTINCITATVIRLKG